MKPYHANIILLELFINELINLFLYCYGFMISYYPRFDIHQIFKRIISLISLMDIQKYVLGWQLCGVTIEEPLSVDLDG